MTDLEIEDAAHLASMLAVHQLCGRLINQLPPGAHITSWELMEDYLGGQYSTTASWNGAKRGLAFLAHTFGLKYSEETLNSLVKVQATGEIDGITVLLWAHLDVPQPPAEEGA